MRLTARVPVAWLNLTDNKLRFAVALAGITFSVLLMFMQLGFWNGLLDGVVALIDTLDADLVIVSKGKYALTTNSPFSRRRLDQAAGVPGVRSAAALYIDFRSFAWKNPDRPDPDGPARRPIRILAFDPDRPALLLPGLPDDLPGLRLPDTALVDRRSKAMYGTMTPGTRRELTGGAVTIVGTFALGTDFVNNGNVIISDVTYARLMEGRHLPSFPGDSPLHRVEVGLLKLEPGADRAAVLAAVRRELPGDVDVLTRAAYSGRERGFWQHYTPMGFVFSLGLVMGVIVGSVICYQILAAEVGDHIEEYATLKAVGFGNVALTRIVLHEALFLSVLGFVPGLLLSWALYHYLAGVTGLPLRLTPRCCGLVLALAVGMCFTAGLLVIRKVHTADPAEVF